MFLMSKNLGGFERFARIVGGSIFLILSVLVFEHPVARLIAILFGLWALVEGISAACPLYHFLGVRKRGPIKPETVLHLMAAGIQVIIGYVWWVSGWHKITGGSFVAMLPKTLAEFSLNNPFPWMRQFLTEICARNSAFIGLLVEFSQYVIGVVLVALAYVWLTAKSDETKRAAFYISIIAFTIGLIMNALFYLAAAHTGPAVREINVLMFWLQAVMVYGYANLLMKNVQNNKKHH